MRKPLELEALRSGGANQLVALPARSVLYNLEPIGLDDYRRESLLSYLIRLARAHCVNPRHLIKHVFGGVDSAIPDLCYNSFFVAYAGTANGLGEYARLFARATNRLTSRSDLESLTMLPWADVIPAKSERFLAEHPRWCPCCFAEQYAAIGESYTPLIWSLDLYTTCTAHRRPMLERCPHCDKHQAFIPRIADAALCCHCGSSLADMPSTAIGNGCTRRESPSLLDAELLTLVSMIRGHDVVASTVNRQNFCRSLRTLIADPVAGNRAAFCRAMGWNIWALNGWLNKGKKVSFPKLIEIGLRFGINPIDFCSAPVSASPLQAILGGGIHDAEPIANRAERPRLSNAKRRELGQALNTQLETVTTPPSLRELGLHSGLRRSTLKYWFPDLCQKICERRIAARRTNAAADHLRRTAIIAEIIRALLDQGISPTRRQVDIRMKKYGLALARPELFQVYRQCMTALAEPLQQT